MHSDTTPSEAGTAAESCPGVPRQTFPRLVTGIDLLLSVVAVVVGPGAVAVLVIVAGVALEQPWLVGSAVPLATLAAVVGLYTALLRRGWTGPDLGFVRARSRSPWHLLWEVPVLWVTALLLTIVIGTLIGIGPAETNPTTTNAADALALGVVGVLATAVCVTILIPALEEILFRRVLLGWLEQRFGIAAALVGSALVFGVVHVAPPVILLQFLIGLGAAILVRAHRTLWAPLALHGLNNGIVTVGALIVVL